eukprot:NODE_31910_length_387_cov_1.626923.p2 GENE.NODE_31910_length_387_cov_1.626923~~NODE_31910_length_387_cov_1.626923.p2  ORF type:complete len:67 (+),score=5.56 NODE_31910_length_387_cov_1.626923:87-287(+)
MCRKSFVLSGLSSDATRCLAKQWLLLGVAMNRDNLECLTKHLRGIARGTLSVFDEAVLDAEVAALE